MFIEILAITSLLVLVYFTVFFIIGTIMRNNGIVDIAWGSGFVLITLFTLFKNQTFLLPQVLISILVSVWGLRLTLHIYSRNKDKPEDFRYAKWREEWGKFVILRSFFQVYILQGVIMLIIAVPILLVNSSQQYKNIIFVILGLLIWIFGFLFEAIGDYQLRNFLKTKKQNQSNRNIKDNKNKIMKKGLWKYTRHPNYFGESVQWWGIFVIALSVNNGIYAIISPLLLTYLLLYFSGIPMLEKKYDDNKEYQQYKKETNAFFPWKRKINL